MTLGDGILKRLCPSFGHIAEAQLTMWVREKQDTLLASRTEQ